MCDCDSRSSREVERSLSTCDCDSRSSREVERSLSTCDCDSRSSRDEQQSLSTCDWYDGWACTDGWLYSGDHFLDISWCIGEQLKAADLTPLPVYKLMSYTAGELVKSMDVFSLQGN